ncbi:MAG TPA: hypothetical protein VFD48_14300, partial [Pyrinomonadaceae bacterium]|nr:hypothetical protein [Pyrinomonadaceae bacterium]
YSIAINMLLLRSKAGDPVSLLTIGGTSWRPTLQPKQFAGGEGWFTPADAGSTPPHLCTTS